MHRLFLLPFSILALAASARAHFLFVVPEPNGSQAYVILSEDLDPDEDVRPGMLSGVELFLRSTDGSVRALHMETTSDAALVALPESGGQLVFGSLDVGVHQAGDKPGNLVTYYTKSILADPFGPNSWLDGEFPVELVPVGEVGDVQFQFLFNGVPQPDVEVTVFLPDGARQRVETDEQGKTPSFAQVGRYGAWAKTKIGGPGEFEGAAYAESRGYATLVTQIGRPAETLVPTSYAPLPQATSSFGAVESEGWLYIYGGHTARTHDYDTEAVSGRFSRLDLSRGGAWQNLPAGPALQGLNLASHKGMVYRVGGMQPRNPRGEPSDNHSIADCVRFDPQSGQWEWLAPMPVGRSSHDLAVVGDTLYVVGGWNMLGRQAGNDFLEFMLTLDLTDPRAAWKRVPQPFSRRALIVSVHDGRIHVMGGIDEDDTVSRAVDIFDPETMSWSRGPDLIGEAKYVGFASAACTLDGRLYASVAGGDLIRLTKDGAAWEFVGTNQPRIVHRLVPWQSRILVTGGANQGSNLDSIEVLHPPAKGVGGMPPSGGQGTPIHANAKTAESVSATPATSAKGQVYCPVMTNVEVLDDEEAISVDYNGIEVLLCCSKCVKKWERDPEAYLLTKVLPQIAEVELPARKLEQTYCPVYPTRVVSESDAFVLYEGKKVYLFNKTAVRRWKEDPEKYLNLDLLPQLAEE